MKEQEKQIKEMAKEIGNTWLVDLEGNTKDVCEVLDEVDINNIARELYDKNYRKLPEDSVVLSKEEYKKLKYTWITDSDAYKKGCKEIAEKILNAQYQECKIAEQDVLKARGGNKNDDYYKGFSLGMTNTKMHIQELARQFGIEIKENNNER